MTAKAPNRFLRLLGLFLVAWFGVVFLSYIFIEDVRKGVHDMVLYVLNAP